MELWAGVLDATHENTALERTRAHFLRVEQRLVSGTGSESWTKEITAVRQKQTYRHF